VDGFSTRYTCSPLLRALFIPLPNPFTLPELKLYLPLPLLLTIFTGTGTSTGLLGRRLLAGLNCGDGGGGARGLQNILLK